MDSVQAQAWTKIRDFTFQGVSYTGLNGSRFSVTKTDVNVDARAWANNGEQVSGNYYITLYRDGWYDESLGTVTYFYGPDKQIYTYTWSGVGPGTYYLNIKSGDSKLLDGDGTIWEQ